MSSRDLAISHSFLLSQELNSFIRVAGMESNSISCPLVEVLMNSEVVKGSQRVKFWKLNQTKTCIAPLPQRDANTWDTGMSAHKVKANLQKNICPLGSLACYKPVLPRTHTHFLVIGRPGLGHTPFLSEVFNFYRSPASKKERGALFLPDLRATGDCLSPSQIYLGSIWGHNSVDSLPGKPLTSGFPSHLHPSKRFLRDRCLFLTCLPI